MQYIALSATTIASDAAGKRLVAGPAFDRQVHADPSGCVLRTRYYCWTEDVDARFHPLDTTEQDLADDEMARGFSLWGRFSSWTAAAVASWGLVVACVMVARALLS